jgi:hypothetical protein
MNTSWYINNQGKTEQETEDITVFSLIIKGKHNRKQKTENSFFKKSLTDIGSYKLYSPLRKLDNSTTTNFYKHKHS